PHRAGLSLPLWRSWRVGEIGRAPDSLRLQKVTPLVGRQDLQSGPNREANHRDEWISEPQPVDVVLRSAVDEFPDPTVAAEEAIENRELDPGSSRLDLLWRARPSRRGRGLDVLVDEPPAEPARRDLLNHSTAAAGQRCRDRLHVHFVSHREVLETLPDAPHAGLRLPIQLIARERSAERACPLVSGVELRDQTRGPAR